MDISSAFSKNAEEYDKWYFEETGSLIFESEVKVIKAMSLKGYGVEVGVGTGAFSLRLGIPLGLDPALGMIKIAKSRKIDIIRAVGEFLSIKSESLDYVLFAFTICFLRELGISLKEAYRVMKPRGNVIVGFISRDSRWGELYSKKKSEGHRFYQDANFYSVKEIETVLKCVGFKITKRFATLTQLLESVKTIEKPSNNINQRGFVCIQAKRIE